MAGMDPATFGAIEPTLVPYSKPPPSLGWKKYQHVRAETAEETYMFAGQTRIFVAKTGIFSG